MSIDRGSWNEFWDDRTEQSADALWNDSVDVGSLGGSSVDSVSSSDAVVMDATQSVMLSDGSISVPQIGASPVSSSSFTLAPAVMAFQSGDGSGSASMAVGCTCCGAMGATNISGLSGIGTSSGQDSITASAPGTLQQLADYLKQGYWAFNGSNFNWKWGTATITFNVTALTAQEQIWAREAFQQFSQICNLTFNEVNSGGNITFVSPNSGQTGFGSAFANFGGSNGTITSATVSISDSWANWSATNPFYNYYYQTYVHEIGHALGLGHQGPYNGSANYPADAAYDNDSWQLSVMSYFDQLENTYAGLNGSFAYVSSLMQADILALQQKYGAPTSGNHYFGNNPTVGASGFNSGTNFGARSFTMYGYDGWVALDTSNYSGTQTIKMGNGEFSSIYGFTDNVSQYASTMSWYSGGSGIDDVTLASSAPVAAGNISVYGNAGNDIFRSTGSFTNTNVDGGAGTDTYTRTLLSLNSSATLKKTSQTNNGWQVGSSSNDHFLSNVEVAQFANTTVNLRQAKSNFNFGYANDAGATSDIVLQNGGTVVGWTIQGNSAVAGTLLGAGVAGWTVKGTGDLDKDGDADIILQNGGTVVLWKTQNGAVQSGNIIGAGVDGWNVVGTGDINNDGDLDVILQNGGTVVAWNIENGVAVSGAVIGAGVLGWTVVGTGDFWGDGSSDVLLQNGGTVVAWNLVNGANAGGVVMGAGVAGWSVKGTGDVNGDGKSDVILQNGGTVVDWIVNNGVAASGNVIGSGVAGWNVVAVGDYNGDGIADVALQNGGTVVTWNLNNGLNAGGFLTGAGVSGWSVMA